MHSPSKNGLFADLNHVFSQKDPKSNVDLKRYPRWVIYVILLGFLGFLIVLLPQIVQNGPNSDREIGQSPGFIKASNLILENRNSDVNPCDDFYEYVCGNYAKNNPLSPQETKQSELSKMKKRVEYQLMDLLQSTENSSSEAISKVKIIYNSCVMESATINLNSQTIVKIVKEIGHWPILMGSQKTDIDPQKMFEKMQSVGVMLPWTIEETWKYLKLDISQFPVLSEDVHSWYDEEEPFSKKRLAERKKGVLKRIQKLAREFGYPKNPQMENDVEEMLNFEMEWNRIIDDDNEDDVDDDQRHVESFDTFNERVRNETGLDLKKIHLTGIPEFAHRLYNSKTGVKVSGNAKNVLHLIKKTEPRILANYFMYMLSPSFEVFVKAEKARGTWKKCKEVAMSMKKAVGALYARKYFPPESRDIIVEMTENLRETVLEMFEENDWMDEETKKEAKKKPKEMIAHIGYNELAFDDEKLDKFYEEIDVSNYSDFFSILRSLNKWYLKEKYMSIISGESREDFPQVSTVSNAVFYEEFNSIMIPAGYSRFPNFLKDQPQSINYGAIGSIIGHEITHGFDNEGKDYDELGRKRNWWNKLTLKKFEEKSECMVEQYSAIEVPGTDGLHLDGEKTLAENIADNGGLREAFRAYKKYVKRHGNEPTLPGVDYTDDQLFFVGYGNFNCGVMKKKVMVDTIDSSVHSPNKYRTNVVLQNMEEFSEAFKCPVGSPMNPEKKCRVW